MQSLSVESNGERSWDFIVDPAGPSASSMGSSMGGMMSQQVRALKKGFYVDSSNDIQYTFVSCQCSEI
jgi:hypothetical protein